MDRAWILLGMMGSGKSTVGHALATLASREFMDTDRLLVQRLGRPISEFFAFYGEEAFRAHETSILRALGPGAYVLATGGGIVTQERNWIEMKRLGVTVFMDVREDLLRERVARGKKRRPLLDFEDWEDRFSNLYTARRPMYERADVVVRIDDERIDESAQTILAAIQAYEGARSA